MSTMAESIAASEDLKMEPLDAPPALPPTAPSKVPYKSWRKKYRKMRQRFDDGMEEANHMFLTTHHLQEVAQRLQEQNDQLLEILTDLNNSTTVPSRYRFDVDDTQEPVLQGSPQSLYSKPPLSLGDIKLKTLEEEVAHTTYELAQTEGKFPAELEDQDNHAPDGYLTPKHEEEYLSVIDNALDVIPLPSPSRPNTIIDPSVDLRPRHTSPPTERDFATQNPISVHNWLLRNKPSIKNEQDAGSERAEVGSVAGGPTDAATSKPAKKKGASKKEKTKEDAPFEGLDDEIGFDAAHEEHVGKSKRRSRGDGDHTYRPKGGRSSRAAKRKRGADDGEETPTVATKKVKGGGSVEVDDDVEA